MRKPERSITGVQGGVELTRYCRLGASFRLPRIGEGDFVDRATHVPRPSMVRVGWNHLMMGQSAGKNLRGIQTHQNSSRIPIARQQVDGNGRMSFGDVVRM